MSLLSYLWRRLMGGRAAAGPAAAPQSGDVDPTREDEARRTSIRDVTREQLGLAQWSCHAHF